MCEKKTFFKKNYGIDNFLYIYPEADESLKNAELVCCDFSLINLGARVKGKKSQAMSDDEPIQKALMETIRKKFLCIHLKELLGECGATKGGKREVMMLRVNDVLAGKCIQYGVVQRRQALEIALDYCARKFDVVIAGGASGGDTLKNLCAESEKAETVSLGDTDGRDRCDAPQPKAVLSEAQALLFKRIETSDPFYVDVYDKELFSSQSALLSDMPVLSPTQLEKQVCFVPSHFFI